VSDKQQYTEWISHYIQREQFYSVINDTKWREAICALEAMPNAPVQFRAKCLGADPATLWDISFPYHIPQPFRSIEWLEINPIFRYFRGALVDDEVVDFTHEVIQALRSVHVPFTQEDSLIRIWGYVQSGNLLVPA